MDILFKLADIGASCVENLLIMGFITRVSGRKYNGKKQWVTVLLLSLLLTSVVTLLNSIEAFSFYTIFIGIFLFITMSSVVSTGDILLRSTACALAFFFLHTMDYLTGFTVALIFDASNIYESFTTLMQPGMMRLTYTVVDKSLQITMFFTLYPIYCKIIVLNRKYLATVLGITIAAYATMSILLNMIITDSLVVLQIAVILSWLFIMLCMIAVLCSVTIGAHYNAHKRESALMALANDLMTKNYQQLYDMQIKVSQQVHDFTNHLKTLDHLLEDEGEAKEYLRELLKSHKQQVKQSRSGNNVIDAIINCKMEEAQRIHAEFHYQVRLPDPDISISPVDICAVLSNQIDNALEACELVPDFSDRKISVEIWKREAFIFSKVINSTISDYFYRENHLATMKNNSDGMHGLGLKNIQDTAERYEGSVEMTCNDGKFTSIVMLQDIR